MLPVTVKFEQPTRRFGRIRFAYFFKFTKHNTLIVYILSPHFLSCKRVSIALKSVHALATIIIFVDSQNDLFCEY